jgi:hypothetical protein
MADDRTEALATRVEALAAALRASGADPEAASRVLESAATAALHALTLDLLLERPRRTPARRGPVAPAATLVQHEPEQAQHVPLAA